ncbi:MAG: site-specific DNA-methyltransferase [Betaproteobacteria bacterium]
MFTNEGRLNPAELLRLTGEMQRDHFDFSWSGKAAAKRKAFSPTTAALRYDEARSVNPDMAGGNCIIEGENLEVLKLLLCAYRGQVKCIYIDPPYNTGNDFVYKDNFAEGTSAYWEHTGVTQDGVKMSTNTRADGRFHSNWLNMIYPRLLVARQLLREDGVIFVSIDDNEVTHLRKVMDEVFGEANFVACIVWQKKYAVSGDDPGVAAMHDYLLCYACTEKFERGLLPRTEKQLVRYTNLDNDSRGDWSSDNYVSNKSKEERPTLWYPIKHPKTGESVWPDEHAVWRYSKEKHEQNEKEGRLYWGPDLSYKKPRLKRYLNEIQDGVVPSTWWPFTECGHNDEAQKETTSLFGDRVFSTPKPVRLLKRILQISVAGNDLVLDFFSGSGALGQAVLEMSVERNTSLDFILVQVPELVDIKSATYEAGFKKISDITIERVKRVIQGYGDNPQPIDTGFKVFTLEKSAFPRADFAPDPDASAEQNLKALKAFIAQKETNLFSQPDAPAVRDEVLLKCGFQLDVQLTPVTEVTANQLYRATDQQTPPRQAIVCFDTSLDTTTLEWLRQQKGQRVILLEAALDTTAKWNLRHALGDELTVF